MKPSNLLASFAAVNGIADAHARATSDETHDAGGTTRHRPGTSHPTTQLPERTSAAATVRNGTVSRHGPHEPARTSHPRSTLETVFVPIPHFVPVTQNVTNTVNVTATHTQTFNQTDTITQTAHPSSSGALSTSSSSPHAPPGATNTATPAASSSRKPLNLGDAIGVEIGGVAAGTLSGAVLGRIAASGYNWAGNKMVALPFSGLGEKLPKLPFPESHRALPGGIAAAAGAAIGAVSVGVGVGVTVLRRSVEASQEKAASGDPSAPKAG